MFPRSAAVFVSIGAGFVIARQFEGAPSGAWLSVACAACAIAGLLDRRACRIALLIAAALFGAGWFALRIHEAPSRSFESAVAPEDSSALVTVEGVVLEAPRAISFQRDPLHPLAHLQQPGLRFWLDADSAVTPAGATPVTGRLRVVLAGTPVPGLRAGDRVRATGEFRPVAPPMNPGEANRRLWAAQDGESGTLRAPGGSLVERLPAPHGVLHSARSTWLAWRGTLRERARAALLGDSPEGGTAPPTEARALLGALLLGEEDPALLEVRSAFTRLGLAHVLAISGFHLTVMAAVVLLALRMTGDRGWVEPAVVAALVAAYLFILPVQAPIWRSGLMTLGLLAADALGRRYDPLAILGWIAVGLVLWRPMDLWSMGFQLSFGLVAVLMWLGLTAFRRIYGVVYAGPHPASPRTIPRWLWDEGRAYVSSSLLCWVVAAPLVMHHTGLFSALGLVASLVLLIPIVALLGASYAALAFGVVFPPAAVISGVVLMPLSEWTITLVRWMDGAPLASFLLPSVSILWTVAATATALYWFARGHLRDWAAWTATGALVAWLVLEVWLGPRLSSAALLRIDTLAVGDGACHLIRSGGWGGEAMLWDCGSLTPGVGRRLVPRAVRALGAWHVPTVVISHPSLDHFNGLLDAARPLGVRRVVVSECFREQAARQPGGAEAFVLAGLRERGIRVDVARLGDELVLGHARVKFISPPGPDVERAWPNENDRSFVAEITVRAGERGVVRRALLTGDIELRAIEHLSTAHHGLRADIMEAPHHGSAKDPAINFVARVDPAVVLQSTGPSRAGDARWDTVRTARDWYTTSLDGAAWAEIRRDGSIRSGAMWRR